VCNVRKDNAATSLNAGPRWGVLTIYPSIRVLPDTQPQWHTTMTLIARNSQKPILVSDMRCGSRTRENRTLLLESATSVSCAKAGFTAYSMLFSRRTIHPMESSVYPQITSHFSPVGRTISIVVHLHPTPSTLVGQRRYLADSGCSPPRKQLYILNSTA
jgi:hypothetical protein